MQIATENQFITNYDIFWQPADQATLIPFLDSFEMRYGRQSVAICADSGYGSEMNYEYLVGNGILPSVKYNMFHKEMTRSVKNNPYLASNMHYNKDEDYYICPMGQRLEYVGETHETSDLGDVSTKSIYQAKNCKGCPLRGECYKGKSHQRRIEVNHRNNELRV